MLSSELARLAGVSVRTLRHYHQIGVLEEPERDVNNYRDYTVEHLAAVLRIVSFTGLGIPLSEIGRVLDDEAAASRLLDRIDRQTADEIQRLEKRRRTISELKTGRAAPDLPAVLIPHADLLRSSMDATPENERQEREQIALVSHFSAGADLSWLVGVLEELGREETRYKDIMNRFAGLSHDTSDTDQALIDDMVELLQTALSVEEIPVLGTEATVLLLDHQDRYHNASQRRVWEAVLRALNEAPAIED